MALLPVKQEAYQVRCLKRALGILGCFSLVRQELSLSELCGLTALPKPTVFRLLSSLERARLVERTPDGQRYQVGIRAFELGNVFLAHLSIETVARPIMESLTERLGVTSNLAILDDGQVVYIATTDPPGQLRYRFIIGYRHYVHCSALGKALISELSPEDVRRILQQHGMPARAPGTLTDPESLLQDLQNTRDRGYALDDQEGAVGFRCLGVPIRDHAGKIVAALSVSAASPRITPETIPALAGDLRGCADEISRRLGWSENRG
ncbi:MAG: IclR family transcriptional regulator [Chloroflexi bacterium]|nr:IclR family transcriptional regulator [Chloroflexota bacterium]